MIKTLVQVIYFALLYAWCYHIHSFYFRFEIANQIALLLSIITGWRIGISKKWQLGWLGWLFLLALPMSLQPVIAMLIAEMSKSWLLIYIIAITCSFVAGSFRNLTPLIVGTITLAGLWHIPYSMPNSQKYFVDKVVKSSQTKMGEVQIVEWKSHFWLHYNNKLQFSTIDKHVLAEAFTYPALYVQPAGIKALILGGDNHLILAQLSQSDRVNHITVVPSNTEFFQFVSDNKALLDIELNSSNLNVSEKSITKYLLDTANFDIIYFDYNTSAHGLRDLLLKKHNLLSENTVLVYPAGNPYLEVNRFKNSLALFDSLGYNVLPYHTQVPTKGQMSWILASKKISSAKMKNKLFHIPSDAQGTWWNQEAMEMMLSFGKVDYFTK